jgi:hypothetical protein
MCADDSKIKAQVLNNEDRLIFQQDIDNVTICCETWCIELNCKKCKLSQFGNSQVVKKFEQT